MPAKAKGPGSTVVMAKTRLMGLAAFFLAGFGAVPKRSPGPASSIAGTGLVRRGYRVAGLRPLIQATGGNQAAALGEGFAPHLAAGEIVTLRVDGRERFEFVFGLCEPRDDTPPHHHQLALSGLAAAADNRLGVTRRGVVVWCDDADVVRGAAHMEVLGDLLFVEEAVIATAHGLLGAENREGISFAVAG
jgi:hypothetical protein